MMTMQIINIFKPIQQVRKEATKEIVQAIALIELEQAINDMLYENK